MGILGPPRGPLDARPVVDFLDPDFYLGDPHAAYDWMRVHEPAFRDARGVYGLTRYADVMFAERHPQLFCSGQGYRAFWGPGEDNMIAQDDPGHAAQRSLVSRRFTPKAVRAHEPWLRSTITSLIDQFVDDGEVEVVAALGAQLPCRLTARLLGWPEERWADVKSWSERLMQIDQAHLNEVHRDNFTAALSEFAGELPDLLRSRRGCPVDAAPDLFSVWANSRIDDQWMAFTTIVNETGLVISGGAETTRTVITRGLRLMCERPDDWEALADDPSLVPAAVEEMIRWITPLHNFYRTVTSEVAVGDQVFQAGDRVLLAYPAANRDPAVFPSPHEFDIGRHPNPHVGFGFGPHFCLGASLARFELTMLFTALSQRITNLRVVAEVVDEPNVFAAAAHSFRLGFDVRPSPVRAS